MNALTCSYKLAVDVIKTFPPLLKHHVNEGIMTSCFKCVGLGLKLCSTRTVDDCKTWLGWLVGDCIAAFRS